MDVIGDPMADSTLLKRDQVFALLNLNLQGGSFKLCSSSALPYYAGTQDLTAPKRRADNGAPIIELEFAGVKMSMESRLRTSSMLFKAKLGSLYVRDVMTKGSLFPLLVSPQQKRVMTILFPCRALGIPFKGFHWIHCARRSDVTL